MPFKFNKTIIGNINYRDSIGLFFGIDTMQVKSKKGFCFYIRVKNNANNTQNINNFFNSLRIGLIDSSTKKNVAIPLPFGSHEASINDLNNETYNVVNSYFNGEPLTKEKAYSPEIELPALSNYQINFSINKMAKNYTMATGTYTKEDLAIGRYRMFIIHSISIKNSIESYSIRLPISYVACE